MQIPNGSTILVAFLRGALAFVTAPSKVLTIEKELLDTKAAILDHAKDVAEKNRRLLEQLDNLNGDVRELKGRLEEHLRRR